MQKVKVPYRIWYGDIKYREAFAQVPEQMADGNIERLLKDAALEIATDRLLQSINLKYKLPSGEKKDVVVKPNPQNNIFNKLSHYDVLDLPENIPSGVKSIFIATYENSLDGDNRYSATITYHSHVKSTNLVKSKKTVLKHLTKIFSGYNVKF